MIRDVPDSTSTTSTLSPHHSSISNTPNGNSHMSADRSPSPLPYAARRRAISRPDGADEAPLPPIPLVVSSPAGGVTTRTLPEDYKPPAPPKHPLVMPPGGQSAMQETPSASFGVTNTMAEGKLSMAELGGASMALQRSVRALDGVERIGRLLTLDLKSNEIKNGVGYIAQVLKRNRTLKVLNLADNRIDGAGLALLAESLKYNSTLETLDMSSNPCCGVQSEGIAALRTAFTVNTSLKRLFLADTGLTTDGAISLAEFLPESKSLLHLDITENPNVETAGILAISMGLKANKLIRCLDVSIPPNNPELAEISQNILQACIRNTELAASSPTLKEGKSESVWVPIKKSTLVRQVKQAEEARAQKERIDLATSPEGKAREYVYTLKPGDVPLVIQKTIRDCEKWFEAGEIAKESQGGHVWEPGQLPKDDWIPLLQRCRVLRERLEEIIGETTESEKLERLLGLNDGLTSVLDRSKGFTPPPRLLLPSQIVPTAASGPSAGNVGMGAQGLPANELSSKFMARRHMRNHSLEISSPNFSIGDSDNDSDPEELDVDVRNMRPGLSANGSNDALMGLGMGMNEVHDPSSIPVHGAGSGVEVLLEGERVETTMSTPENGSLIDGDESSPVEKVSKAWVEEEGEIFRKGTKLGVGEDDENDEDVPGELLKQEILDTPVARNSTRRRMSVDEAEILPDDESREGHGEARGERDEVRA